MSISKSHIAGSKLATLMELPEADRLLKALRERSGVYLVGGAVRDLVLGFQQFDYDLVVEGDAAETASALADQLGGSVVVHDRFMTATYRSHDDSLVVDVASARTETYPRPGALPTVAPASLAEDLWRRDFTINSMAVALWGARLGELTEVDGAMVDLKAGVLRVLHRDSFIDDPTRLLRMLRYGGRLGFSAVPMTEDWARAAVEAGAPSTVSGARIGDELMDLLAERGALRSIDAMYALGLDRALHEQFSADEYLASRVLWRLPEGLCQEALLLAACSIQMDEVTLARWLEHLAVSQRTRKIVIDAVVRHADVVASLASGSNASEVDNVLRGFKPETVALAAAVPGVDPDVTKRIHGWLSGRHDRHLLINGADLLVAGVPEGPQIGRALAASLAKTIDGEISGRDQQLEHALAFARSEQ